MYVHLLFISMAKLLHLFRNLSTNKVHVAVKTSQELFADGIRVLKNNICRDKELQATKVAQTYNALNTMLFLGVSIFFLQFYWSQV